jgi:phosphoglucosamine mutase
MSLQGMKIVVDCAHGAAYHIAPNVFEELDATVTAIGCEPDGLNINAGVGAIHPQALQAAVVQQNANVGIALDGDGDRLILVNKQGRVIDGDSILYIIARSRQANGNLHGPVIGTVMSNLGLEQALQRHGIDFERTQVGDRYILERMKAVGATLGGEPSGHIICKDRLTTGDGIISALQVLAEMVASNKDLDSMLTDLNIYPQSLINVRMPQRVDVLSLPVVQDAVQQAEFELGNTGRVLLRLSGTEPLLRIMVEGQHAEQVKNLANELANIMRSQL